MKQFQSHEILDFHARGLINADRAREMLGLNEPEKPPAQSAQPAFESERARERFKACLRDCGLIADEELYPSQIVDPTPCYCPKCRKGVGWQPQRGLCPNCGEPVHPRLVKA